MWKPLLISLALSSFIVSCEGPSLAEMITENLKKYQENERERKAKECDNICPYPQKD